jgi:hypothetical protein
MQRRLTELFHILREALKMFERKMSSSIPFVNVIASVVLEQKLLLAFDN